MEILYFRCPWDRIQEAMTNETKSMLKALPLGTSNFSALRQGNEIYVDKTRLVYKLAQSRGKIFLARPRRFGKSLLISTFESLFKNGLRDFGGLDIEKLWDDKTYPVVRLDFSKIKGQASIELFNQAFYDALQEAFTPLGFTYDPNRTSLLAQLDTWTQNLSDNSIVVLIDEYDAPLTEKMDNPMLFNAIRDSLSQFFSLLKSNEGCLRFFFMTGITKFSNTSIFSAFNNLEDISLDEGFGELLGYTEEEIAEYFGPYLQKAQDSLGLNQSELFSQLREQYDGFSFDRRAATHVYCPWSVLNFLKRPQEGFQNYWYTSGGQPTVLMKFLGKHVLSEPIGYSENKVVRLSDLNTSRQYDEINLDVLLTQAGYLTIRSVMKNGYAVLGYPNQEVSMSMAQLYSDELLSGKPLERPEYPLITDIMTEGAAEEVIEAFNRAVSAIDYQRYPITDEASCRAYLQVLLIGAAMMPHVEVHNALGRSDMEVYAGRRHWVFEFKYAKTDDQAEGLLRQAQEQLKARRYGGLSKSAQELIRVALVFSGQQRQFVDWSVV